MERSSISNSLAAQPELVAIAVLVLGVVAARLASAGCGYLLNALDRRMARMTTTETSALSPRIIDVARKFVFWLVIILAVAIAVRTLGVADATGINDSIIALIPNALVGLVIVVAGHLLGLLASNLLVQLSENIPAESLAPRLLHGAIFTIAVVMGLQHVGIDITFITRLLLILVAIIGGGLMLAFAIGARQHVANLLARREVNRLNVGEKICVDDVEGSIVDVYSTGVDVATRKGIVSIPAARFAETKVLRLRPDGDDG